MKTKIVKRNVSGFFIFMTIFLVELTVLSVLVSGYYLFTRRGLTDLENQFQNKGREMVSSYSLMAREELWQSKKSNLSGLFHRVRNKQKRWGDSLDKLFYIDRFGKLAAHSEISYLATPSYNPDYNKGVFIQAQDLRGGAIESTPWENTRKLMVPYFFDIMTGHRPELAAPAQLFSTPLYRVVKGKRMLAGTLHLILRRQAHREFLNETFYIFSIAFWVAFVLGLIISAILLLIYQVNLKNHHSVRMETFSDTQLEKKVIEEPPSPPENVREKLLPGHKDSHPARELGVRPRLSSWHGTGPHEPPARSPEIKDAIFIEDDDA